MMLGVSGLYDSEYAAIATRSDETQLTLEWLKTSLHSPLKKRK